MKRVGSRSHDVVGANRNDIMCAAGGVVTHLKRQLEIWLTKLGRMRRSLERVAKFIGSSGLGSIYFADLCVLVIA
jgi:hypothetical protein